MRRIWPLATAIVILGYFGLPLLGQSLLYMAISVLAAAIVLAGPGRTGDATSGWRWIGLGLMTAAGGNLIRFYDEIIAQVPPFPSVADVLYVASYLMSATGLIRLARAAGRRDPGALIDAMVVAIGAGILAWVTVITPYATDSSLSLLLRVMAIAYPACDLLLLTLLLRLPFAGPTRRHPALVLLSLSFTLTLVANAGLAWVSLHGVYATGHPLDALWLLGHVLAGSAALHPSSRTVVPVEQDRPVPLLPRWRLSLLAVASLVAPALVVSAGSQHADLDLVVIGAAAAVLSLLVLWRMARLVRKISVQATELDALSTTDPLTGVANRRAWDAQLGTAVAHARRTAAPVAIALLDLDHFKTFNDRFGHAAGDTILQQAAAAWKATLRPGDLLARIGGEEFAVLLIACDSDAALAAVERMRSATPATTSCSAGIAVLQPGDTPSDLLARADAALYQAKRAGRDRAVVAAVAVR